MRHSPSAAAMAAIALMTLASCVPAGHLTPGRAPTPIFDAAVFFTGRTHGEGLLKIATRRTERVVVEGSGHVDGDGAIILDQSVQQGGRAARLRQWRLFLDRPGHYAGTVSDAAGPVAGEVTGNLLHLSFAMSGGLRADQWLTLEPGGDRVRNVMIVRKFGLPLARLDETIVQAGH